MMKPKMSADYSIFPNNTQPSYQTEEIVHRVPESLGFCQS